jgi:hypothetical protein
VIWLFAATKFVPRGLNAVAPIVVLQHVARQAHTAAAMGTAVVLMAGRVKAYSGTTSAVRSHGCSTLRNSDEFEEVVDSCESGPVAVAVLAERVGLVGLEDVVGEAAQAGKHAGVGSNARAVFAMETSRL